MHVGVSNCKATLNFFSLAWVFNHFLRLSNILNDISNLNVHEIYQVAVNFVEIRLDYVVVCSQFAEHTASVHFFTGSEKQKALIYTLHISLFPNKNIFYKTSDFHSENALL